jgi:hypothetical protein
MIRAALLATALAGAAHAQASDIPRAADERPDLQGYWSNEFLTPLERIEGATAVVASEAEAKSLVDGILVQRSKHQFETAPLMAAFRKAWNETAAN